MSILNERQKYQPVVPNCLRDIESLEIEEREVTKSVADSEEIEKLFSHIFGKPIITLQGIGKGKEREGGLRMGVVFSGGQAAGGHNVIAGIYDAAIQIDPKAVIVGFIGGPSGIVEGDSRELSGDEIDAVRNTGGFDLIGSGRTKIKTPEQLEASVKTFNKLKLDGLVIIGGDDSNTNAAVLAEYCLNHECATHVVGVPKTIDGDLKNDEVEISFGFDTACKCYSEMISNIERDAISAKKYYHFVKLMGRSASHIALECALQTHPNYTLIGEEVREKNLTLDAIISDIAEMIVKRSEMDHHFGVILIPEGLIEFIPEMSVLIGELNDLISKGSGEDIVGMLSDASKETYHSIPEGIQKQLIMDRDPHGNVQVSHIATEGLVLEGVKAKLAEMNFTGKFNAVQHFFGYEGRAAYPSNFDATYCYALGRTAVALISAGYTGYMGVLQNLSRPPEEWSAVGVPLTAMMNIERRHGKPTPVIKKYLVDLKGPAFSQFAHNREEWKYEPCYQYVGAIQYFGPTEVTDTVPLSLAPRSS